eukprot:TRINITY_DN4033_c0_g2_i12.p2 TRINITY_DN4033_c0_g2~~TRINITY_DN4033_c0_g2_i12.p2  ORF type:complete len:180 (+),score=51.08 TRINITY_DN4033_c0_g2_i12:1196-1735(+)
MPSLTFSMSEDGAPIQIPFFKMVLEQPDYSSPLTLVEHRFAIRKLPYQGKGVIPTTTIILGIQPLECIYTVVDFESQRVAMAQTPGYEKPKLPAGSSEMCASRPTCIGSQVYYAPMNTCLDPDCRKYFFQTLNSERECEVSSASLIVLAIVIAIFAGVEVFLFEERGKLVTRVELARDE